MFRASATLVSILFLASFALADSAASPQQSPTPPQGQSPPPEITAVTPQAMQPAPPPSPDATLEQLEREGDVLRTNKMYLDAIEYYKACLKKAPLSSKDKVVQAQQHTQAAKLYNKLGIAELSLLRIKEARKSFERAIKLDKQFPDAYNNAGVTYYLEVARKKGRGFGKSIKFYRKAILLNDLMASAHNNLATAYFSSKEYDKAFVEYQRALQLDPEILERNSRAGVAMRMSSPEDQAAYQFMIARLYAQLKDPDHCLLYLEKAIEGGYPKIKDVYKDQAFNDVRKDPRFETMMARAASSQVN